MKYPLLLLPVMLPIAAIVYCCAFVRQRVFAGDKYWNESPAERRSRIENEAAQ